MAYSDFLKSNAEWPGVDWGFILEIIFVALTAIFLVLFLICCCKSRRLKLLALENDKKILAAQQINDELVQQRDTLQADLDFSLDNERFLRDHTSQLKGMFVSSERALMLYSSATQKLRATSCNLMAESSFLAKEASAIGYNERSLLVELWVNDPEFGRPVRWTSDRMSFVGEMWLPSFEHLRQQALRSGDNRFSMRGNFPFVSEVHNSRDDPLKKFAASCGMYAKMCSALDRDVRDHASKFVDDIPAYLEKNDGNDLIPSISDLISAEISLQLTTSTDHIQQDAPTVMSPSSRLFSSAQPANNLIPGVVQVQQNLLDVQIGNLSGLATTLFEPIPDPIGKLSTLKSKKANENTPLDKRNTLNDISTIPKSESVQQNTSNEPLKQPSNIAIGKSTVTQSDPSPHLLKTSIVSPSTNDKETKPQAKLNSRSSFQSVIVTILVWDRRKVNQMKPMNSTHNNPNHQNMSMNNYNFGQYPVDGPVAQPRAAHDDSPRMMLGGQTLNSTRSAFGQTITSPNNTGNQLVWELVAQSVPLVVSTSGSTFVNVKTSVSERKFIEDQVVPQKFQPPARPAELQQKEKEITALQRDNVNLQREIDALRGLAKDRTSALDSKQVELKRLEAEIAALKASSYHEKTLAGVTPTSTSLSKFAAVSNQPPSAVPPSAALAQSSPMSLADQIELSHNLWSSMCVKHQGVLARDEIAEVKCVLNFSADQIDGSRCVIELRIQASSGIRFSKVEFECVNHERGALLLALLPMTTTRGPPLQFISVIHAEMVAPFFEPPTCEAKIELADGSEHLITFKLPLHAGRFLTPAGAISSPPSGQMGTVQNTHQLSHLSPIPADVFLRDWNDSQRMATAAKLLRIHPSLALEGEDAIARVALAGGALGEITTVQHHMAEGALLGAARWIRRNSNLIPGSTTPNASGIPVLLRLWTASGHLSGLVKLEIKCADADLAASVCAGLASLLGDEVSGGNQFGNQSYDTINSNQGALYINNNSNNFYGSNRSQGYQR
eukprot:GDKK01043215.1.p1 GENE.GDKK01043215.1~~GDKK01043215.1.p1  ORF type:complete len:1016 (+),score=222.18 GDKK01043215.1:23-3049(+)